MQRICTGAQEKIPDVGKEDPLAKDVLRHKLKWRDIKDIPGTERDQTNLAEVLYLHVGPPDQNIVKHSSWISN